MRTAYIGTSEFAASVLDALAASAHRPSLVITRPPKPKGRGRQLAPTAVAQRAEHLGIEVLAPARLDDAAEALTRADPQVVCVCAYGALVREPLLSAYEMINVHPSLLPRWRGAAPVERAIIAGDEETGVSIMRLVAELDAGPVCARESLAIEPTDSYGVLAARLASAASRLLLASLDGPRNYLDQPEAGVTYAEKISPADRVLDPARGATELERVVRALHPHIGARLPSGLGVTQARVLHDDAPEVPVGELAVRDARLLYGTAGPGGLELLRVKPAGGREMDAASFIRGHAV